jgi:hypothetical protein
VLPIPQASRHFTAKIWENVSPSPVEQGKGPIHKDLYQAKAFLKRKDMAPSLRPSSLVPPPGPPSILSTRSEENWGTIGVEVGVGAHGLGFRAEIDVATCLGLTMVQGCLAPILWCPYTGKDIELRYPRPPCIGDGGGNFFKI